jgi:hypothetical protein
MDRRLAVVSPNLWAYIGALMALPQQLMSIFARRHC